MTRISSRITSYDVIILISLLKNFLFLFLFCSVWFLAFLFALSTFFPTQSFALVLAFNLSFCFLSGPRAPPANVRGNSTNTTSIFVQWDQVPAAHRNGVILYYTIMYRACYGGFSRTVVVVAPKMQTTLTGLTESTCYSISVYASTIKGDGSSSYINIATGKSNEFPFS